MTSHTEEEPAGSKPSQAKHAGENEAEPLRGRTTISARAIRRVASAISAEVLEVPVAQVGVELADKDGALAIVLHAPIRLAPLTEGRVARAQTLGGEGTLLDRAVSAQQAITKRLNAMTGRAIGQTELRLTGAHIERGRRTR